MRHFFGWALAILIFCQPLQSMSQSQDPDLVDYTLARVNQFRIENQNDSALYELIALNRTLKELGKESGYVSVDIGNIYYQLRLDKMARTFYRKALRLFREANDRVGESIVLENYGNLVGRKNPTDDSVHYYFSHALELQHEAGDKFYAAHSQRALAQYYSQANLFAKARVEIKKAIRAIEDPSIVQHPRYRWDVQFIPQQVYLTASDIYRHEGSRIDSAEYFLRKAIDMTSRHGIAAHRVRYVTFLSTFYLEQKQPDRAWTSVQAALSLADSIGYVWGKLGALQVVRNYYHQTKDVAKENEAAHAYLAYKDQMYNERNNDELMLMTNLMLQYENEQEIERQQELVREKEERNKLQQRQNIQLLVLSGILLVGFVAIFWLYRSLRAKTRLVERYSRDVNQSNETMKTMLSVISHDVRSPFNSLLGLTKVTLMEKELPSDEYRVRLGMMHETASKGLILLDNLLQWVALQRDQTLIRKESVEISVLVEETLRDLQAVALTQNVNIEKQVEAGSIETDRHSMKTIIRNLLTNAIKYSAGKSVFLHAVRQGSEWVIAVRDQGPGVPEELLQSLFEKGDMKKVAAKGSGLGMQIVRQMVTELGGTVSAKNPPEGGALFEVRVPAH